jgi:CHAT domain-containing protein/tetratricopeptide (TPR) repeat protein
MVGAALLPLAIFAGLLLWNQMEGPRVERLLSRAYRERRTLEPRIPGAVYVPLSSSRGDTPHADASPSLLEAEVKIQKTLKTHPRDPVWLQYDARAKLLQGQYAEAIASLQKALESQDEPAHFLTDLATAYFQRAEKSHRAIDYGTAIDLQSRVLAATPDDPVALFNRSLSFERTFLYRQAAMDLEHLLRTNPGDAWSREVAERLQRIREKLSSYRDFRDELIRDPGTFTKQVEPESSSVARNLSDHADDYLDVAISEWLVQAVDPSIPAVRKQEARRAAAWLSQFLKVSRQDRWLADMLGDLENPGIFKAMQGLARAISAAQSGDYDSAVEEAARAETGFRQSGSTAGILRARYERVNALDRQAKGSLCRQQAAQLTFLLTRRRYLWLKIQALSEEATCRSITGDIDGASEESDQAVDLAKHSGYRAVYLRALGNAASINDLKGDFNKAWNRHLEGLQQYWNGNYPPVRAFLFYSELSYVAEDGEQTYAAAALAQEAVLAIAPEKSQSVEALARYRWAGLAETSGAEAEAREQFAAADRMFSEIDRNASKDKPKTTLTAYQTAGRVMLANLEARRGKLDESLALLDKAKPGLASIENYTVPLQFYSTLGEVFLKRGERDAAVKALRSAMSIGEVGARTMKQEHDRLIWDRQVGKAYRNMVKLLFLNDHNVEEALNLWEWYRGLSLRTVQASNAKNSEPEEIDFARLEKDPVLPVPRLLADVQPQLKSATVLSYAQMDDGIAVWVWDDRGINAEWIHHSQKEIDELIGRFNHECADPESDLSALKHDGHQLYRLLVSPVALQLDAARSLVIEADGAISTLAFEALVDDDGGFLGSRFATTASLGADYMRHLRRDDLITPDLPALVVGPPTLRGEIAGQYLPIPDATREAEVIAGRFLTTDLLMGSRATATALTKLLPRAAVFHFAGHALAGEERAGLLLASEEADNNGPAKISLLNASTLDPALAAHARLVVLSGCSTANANLSRTADPDNLVNSFLRAGVPHVVASRWDVESKATDHLMEEFYSHLFSGETVAIALRHVRMNMLAVRETSHPYYWAAFAAFGRS